MSQIRRSLGSVPASVFTSEVVQHPDGRVTRVEYKAIKSGDEVVGQVTVIHMLGERFLATLTVPASEFRFKEADGPKPAHFHCRIAGVDVHLRDGLTPTDLKTRPVAIEVKSRNVSSTTGPKKPKYVYINAYPTAEGTESRESVHIGRNAPAGDLVQVQSWKEEAPGTIFLTVPADPAP